MSKQRSRQNHPVRDSFIRLNYFQFSAPLNDSFPHRLSIFDANLKPPQLFLDIASSPVMFWAIYFCKEIDWFFTTHPFDLIWCKVRL